METIEDIVGDIRAQNQGLPEDGYALSPLVCDLLRLADRIEAAHEREQEDVIAATVVAAAKSASEVYEPHIQSEPVGNSAKMREAIAKCVKLITEFGNAEIVKTPLDVIIDIETILNAALSAPARNCDVGTEQEQQDRFREFCRHYESKGECGIGRSKAACPAFQGGRNPDCSLWWSQMPYESEVKE